MPVAPLTPDIIVRTLKHSNVPAIICEGDDDIIVYREVEKILGPTNVSIQQAGGRTALLEIFRRRNEFSNIRTVFFADKDLWVFTGIPVDYNGIHFTDGYSIENDLLAHSPVEQLLKPEEEAQYRICLNDLADWFGFVVECHQAGNLCEFASIGRILDSTNRFSRNYQQVIGFRPPDPNLREDIINNYRMKLRGKTWLQLLLRFLSKSTRKSKYSANNLMELGLALWSTEATTRRVLIAKQALGI